jgi:hypothetical protein
MPLPRNEKGGIQGNSRTPPYISIELEKQSEGKVIPPKI